QNQQCGEELRTKPDDEIENCVLGVLEGLDLVVHGRSVTDGCREKESEEAPNWILSVPPDAGAIEASEERLQRPAELDELDEPRQLRGRVHVTDSAATRHFGEKGELRTGRALGLHVR